MLYQNNRPDQLDLVLGNKAAVTMLKSVIAAPPDKRPHAFLFFGPKGCGKTTLARIVAKSVGAEDIDIIELNAANTGGVDTIRNSAISASLHPLFGKAKVYIYDESHRLTDAAQQCLLKVTEDAPAHAYFMFCTTEPDKLIGTLKDRCAKFQVQLLRPPDMRVLVKRTADAEKIPCSPELVTAICDAADGSPRTALMMLEQIQGIADPVEAIAVIKDAADAEREGIELCREIVDTRAGRWARCQAVLKQNSDEPERLRQSILTYLRKCMLGSTSIEECDRFSQLIRVFEPSIFGGGNAMLTRMIFEACCL